MRRLDPLSRIFLTLFACAIIPLPIVAAADKGSTAALATVNGVVIPQSDLEFIVKRQIAKGAKDTPEMRGQIRDFLVTQQLVVQEATKEGVDKSADFMEEEKLSRLDALRDVLFDHYVTAHPVKAKTAADKGAATRAQIEAFVKDLKGKAKIADQAGAAAVINGVVVPMADSNFIVAHQTQQGAKDTPELRAKVRDFLIIQQIIAQEASREGLDKTAEFQTVGKLSRYDALRNGLFVHYVKANPIADSAIKAEYSKIAAQAASQKEYHARHILLKTEADAMSVLAALKGGQTFDALAKAKSTDEGSKANGGDLGWTVPQKFDKDFAEAMVKLNKGDTTQAPVKTQFGYHIIHMDDVRPVAQPTFDQAKPQLQQMMERKQLEKLMDDLKAKAKIA